MSLLGAGCATQGPVAVQESHSATPLLAAALPTKVVETRYEVRGYREPGNPDVRHEAHTVYRRSLVPASASDELANGSRDSFAPPGYTPLSESDELAAELATQRAITSEIRAIQASMAETERQMQAQYAQLLDQSAEVMKARGQLEAERRRASTAPTETSDAAPVGVRVESAEVKW